MRLAIVLRMAACGLIVAAAACTGKKAGGDAASAPDAAWDVPGETANPDACQPNCEGRQCGSDGCGGSCGECPAGTGCLPEFREPGTGAKCISKDDCSAYCAASAQACGEIRPLCDDCERPRLAAFCDCGGCPAGQECTSCWPNNEGPVTSVCCPTCEALCKDAGYECHGLRSPCVSECSDYDALCSCGDCAPGQACVNGPTDLYVCAPQEQACSDLVCDGSGFCYYEQCCLPDCLAKECGPDGCGGSCGECAEGTECWSGACVCWPDCNGKGTCEPDGCGSVCGTCPSGSTCVDGQCVCVPTCEGKECGDDGCGLSCGTCPQSAPFCTLEGSCFEAADCSGFDPSGLTVFRMPMLGIGDGGHPGEALDLDGDDTTCTPANDCEQGYDNFFAIAAPLVEPDDPAEPGAIIALAPGFNMEGAPFSFGLASGVAAAPLEECDWNSGSCPHELAIASLDPVSCQPTLLFGNAAVLGGMLHAGGPGTVLEVYFSPGYPVPIHFYHAQLQGSVTLVGGEVWLEDVILGFVLSIPEIDEFVCGMPDSVPMPVSCDMLKNLLTSYVGDFDLDGNGIGDAISVAVKFTGIPATLTGMY